MFPSHDQGVTTLSARSTLVLVPTTVRTKAGEPVFTLEAKDFVVTDDGVPQKVRLEEDSGALPLALVVVVEAGGDGANKLDEYSGLGTMVEAIAGAVPHKVALVGFDSEPALVQPWTESFERMDKSLADLGPGDGKDAVLDALAFAVDLLKKQPAGYRRAILLVSETVDHGSKTRLNDALRAVSDTNTVIYSLGFSSTRSEVKDEAAKLNGTEPGPAQRLHGQGPQPRGAARQGGAGVRLSGTVGPPAAAGADGADCGARRAANERAGNRGAAYGRGILQIRERQRAGKGPPGDLQPNAEPVFPELPAGTAAGRAACGGGGTGGAAGQRGGRGAKKATGRAGRFRLLSSGSWDALRAGTPLPAAQRRFFAQRSACPRADSRALRNPAFHP